MLKEGKFLKYEGKKIFYYLKRGKKIFLFIHGVGGCSEHFFKVKNYLKDDNGFLLIDLPGFGRSFRKGAPPKNLLRHHFKSMIFVLKHLNIKKINVIFFSLSTCYLKFLIFSSKWKDVEKVFFIEPSIVKHDLDWSLKVFELGRTEYKNYIKKFKSNYKKVLNLTFPDISSKKKDIFIQSIKKMNGEYLHNLIKNSVQLILSKKILFLIKNLKKKVFFIYSEKNSQYKFKIKKKRNRFYKIKSKYHHIMLDKPKEVYSKILK